MIIVMGLDGNLAGSSAPIEEFTEINNRMITQGKNFQTRKVHDNRRTMNSLCISIPPSSEKFDKNSLWGGLNIPKRELCVKGI
jgi:hypothetical protein